MEPRRDGGSGRWNSLPGDGAAPAFFLTSGEDTFWSEPRACWPLSTVPGPDPARGILVMIIDPPAIGQGFGLGGEDITTTAVTPRHEGRSINPLSSLPMEVHILLFKKPSHADQRDLGVDDLRPVAWGKLVPTREEAEANDASMQHMNGPRV